MGDIGESFKKFFNSFGQNWLGYLLQFILIAVVFYYVFKILITNKGGKFIAVVTGAIVISGLAFALTDNDKLSQELLIIVILMIALLVFTMFHTEIKRSLLDSNVKKSKKQDNITVTGVELIIEETVRAVQNMSKKDIGALIVLSNENLPEGIIESGTVVNADITAQMIEAVFYPKAPLHDGAMVIEGTKIYAAGCFLPLAQSEKLPKDMGSRHRAALGVTSVASVTAIVVSEETGIISIAKNGVIRKKYADAADIKNALSEYYWSDLTAEGKL
ncbi:MAG: diadenylate cyclase [Clostridia bacterium]|nr:diadenylate cyclase [Clostridia bacterium]